MTNSADVDPVAILASLAITPVAAPTPLGGGRDTSIWRFATADGRAHTLRLFRREQQAAVGREQVALVAAAAGGLPVPRLEASGLWQDAPVLVLSWLDGETLLSELERRPRRVITLGRSFGRLQRRMHILAAPAALVEGAPAAWLARAGARERALVDHLLALPARRDRLVHLDFHPLNVLVHHGRLSGVVDWTNAAAGDPRADLAWTATALGTVPLPSGPARLPMRLGLSLFTLAWQRGYGAACPPAPTLAPFVAWAGTVRVREIEARMHKPGAGETAADLTRMRRWTARWKRRAGLD